MKLWVLMLNIVGFLVAGLQDPTDRYRPPKSQDLMMISSDDGNDVALFDGRWYSVGDELKGSQWRIQSIDSENAVVVLGNESVEKAVRLWD